MNAGLELASDSDSFQVRDKELASGDQVGEKRHHLMRGERQRVGLNLVTSHSTASLQDSSLKLAGMTGKGGAGHSQSRSSR